MNVIDFFKSEFHFVLSVLYISWKLVVKVQGVPCCPALPAAPSLPSCGCRCSVLLAVPPPRLSCCCWRPCCGRWLSAEEPPPPLHCQSDAAAFAQCSCAPPAAPGRWAGCQLHLGAARPRGPIVRARRPAGRRHRRHGGGCHHCSLPAHQLPARGVRARAGIGWAPSRMAGPPAPEAMGDMDVGGAASPLPSKRHLPH